MKIKILIVKAAKTLTFISQNTVLLVVIGSIIGFLLAWSIFFFEDLIPHKLLGNAFIVCKECNYSEKDLNGILNRHPDFFLWIMLFIIHTGFSLGLGFIAFRDVKVEILSNPNYKLHRSEIATSIILCCITSVVCSLGYILPFNEGNYYAWAYTPLNHQYLKVSLMLGMDVVSGGYAIHGVILISFVCRKILETDLVGKNMISIYKHLNKSVENLLFISGAILSLGLIPVYYFFQSANSVHKANLYGLPETTIWGLLFTMFIAITFIPSKLILLRLGEKIIDKQISSRYYTNNEIDKIGEWLSARNEMEKYLKLNSNPIDNIKYAITVLGPLLTSLLTHVLKK